MAKKGRGFIEMGLLNHMYLTNDLMNWADWLDDFYMLIVMK